MWRWRFSKRTKRLTFLAVGKWFFFIYFFFCGCNNTVQQTGCQLFFFFFFNPLTWCRWERCLLGSRTGAVSWTRDPRGCRGESPGFLRTSTPWRRALREDRETQRRRRSRRVRLCVCLRMIRSHLHHLNTSLARSPATFVLQQMAASCKSAVWSCCSR